jgi:hypothetical protein
MRIEHDGVVLRTRRSISKLVLCKWLWWHAWRYWRMSDGFERTFPYIQEVQRTCARCGFMECAACVTGRDPQIWRARA